MSSLFDEEDEPKDWEIRDEEAPEHLEKKWEAREKDLQPSIECPSCHKLVPHASLTCLFCGAQVCRDSGFLRKFLNWLMGK